MFAKVKMLILICIALMFTLCACTQSQVNDDRLPNNDSAETTDPTDSDATTDPNEDMYGETIYTMGKYVEAGRVFETDDFDGSGSGHVNFYVKDVKMADNMEGAGIDSAKYQLSGRRTYDYYVAVSLTIENVDVPVDDGVTADYSDHVKYPYISFRLRVDDDADIEIEPDYFDQGGVANPDSKRYFQYELPGIGETLDVVIAFGIDKELLDLRETKDPLFLRLEYTSGMMPIEVTL